MTVDIEAHFAEADEVIERSRRLTERATRTAKPSDKGADLFAVRPMIINEQRPDPATAPPKRRWQTKL